MLIGHYAVALAARRVSPVVSPGTLLLATQLLDLLWGALPAAGAERVRIVPGITASTPFDFISYPFFFAAWGHRADRHREVVARGR